MKKLLLTTALIATLSLATTPIFACKQKQVDVSVNGLVCDFCARALEKIFKQQAMVDYITVDLGNGKVSVFYNGEETLPDATITKLITDAGYNVTAIKQEC